MNLTVLTGNLTRDPELRQAGANNTVCRFSLAVNRRFSDKEETSFFDVECWNKTAELVQKYLSKGKRVLVEGRLKQDTWEDKESGQKRSKVLIVADRVEFLSASDKSSSTVEDDTPTNPDANPADGDDEQVPF